MIPGFYSIATSNFTAIDIIERNLWTDPTKLYEKCADVTYLLLGCWIQLDISIEKND